VIAEGCTHDRIAVEFVDRLAKRLRQDADAEFTTFAFVESE
jgi:hypothetical protein